LAGHGLRPQSFWVTVRDKKGSVKNLQRPHEEGGIYVEEGTTFAILHVTYFYWSKVQEMLHCRGSGIKWFDGRTSWQVKQRVLPALKAMPEDWDTTENYWEPTDGNVAWALLILYQWAELFPDGIFIVTTSEPEVMNEKWGEKRSDGDKRSKEPGHPLTPKQQKRRSSSSSVAARRLSGDDYSCRRVGIRARKVR